MAIEEWNPENIQAAINSTAEELEVGMGKVGMPLRVAVTGGGNSVVRYHVESYLKRENWRENRQSAYFYSKQENS